MGAGQSVKIAGQFSWRMPSRAERAQHETQPALKLCSLTKPQHHKSARTHMHEEVVLEICVFNDAHMSVGHVGWGGAQEPSETRGVGSPRNAVTGGCKPLNVNARD